MKREINDNGETTYLSYSPFEIEISSLLFSLYGGSTEPLYEQKVRWEYIQTLKKLAQDELKTDKDDIMFNKAMAKMGVCPNCIEGRTKPRNGKKPMILLERDKKQ